MNHLLRDLAPISDAAWTEIESEASRTLKRTLAGRRLVDFAGPQGWDAAAVGTGRTEPATPPALPQRAPPGLDVQARKRQVLPMVELRVPFALQRSELEAIDRGAKDPDTEPVTAAARAIAIAEDRAIFYGMASAGIRGICEAQSEATVALDDEPTGWPSRIAMALNRLRDTGVDGPYAVALGERCYTRLTEATTGGYPVLEHVRRLIDGPLVWTAALDGAVVMSLRGEDFSLTVGQDFSIGYLGHDAETVRLYIEESFTFWLISPQAAIPLAFPAGEGNGAF